MTEPLQKLTMMGGEKIGTQSSSSDDVVEISLISSEEDKQESSSIQEIITGNAKNLEAFPIDPCLLCAQPIQNQKGREHAPLYNYTRLFGFLCKGLSLKPIYGMVKGDWNFNSTSFPFCESCETLINSLAGVYTRLEAIKTELKDRMEDGEEVYMREELYSKNNVRYFNFRKLVLGAKFQGTVKGRMFQRNHTPSTSGLTRPTCFDESMFPPNHPGSQSLLKTTTADPEGTGSSSSSSSSTPAIPPPPSPRKKWKGSTSRIPPVASLSQGSSSASSSLKPVGVGAPFDPTRFHRFSKRKPPLPSTLKRNTSNHLTPMYIPDTSGFMEMDPETRKITYYSSGATKKPRKILCFTPTPENDQYQCNECREFVPFLHVRKIQQQQLFKNHLLKVHSGPQRCKMCRREGDGGEDKEPMDKEELIAHLESQHGITDWGDYLQLSQLHGNNNKNSTDKIECEPQRNLL